MSDPHFQSQFPIRTLLVPQGAEYRAVQRGCRRAQTAIPIVPLPMGPAAATGLERWLKQSNPLAAAGCLLLGLGGGLAPELQVGDMVLCESIQPMAQPAAIEFDPDLTAWIGQRLPGVKTGKAMGCDRILTLAQEKQRLHQQWGGALVEMESLSILKVLQAEGKQLAMVRVISDDCRHDLPDIATAIRPDGSLRPVALATQFMQRPIGAGRLIVGSLKGLAGLEQLVLQLLREDT
jgi:hypothetical protein